MSGRNDSYFAGSLKMYVKINYEIFNGSRIVDYKVWFATHWKLLHIPPVQVYRKVIIMRQIGKIQIVPMHLDYLDILQSVKSTRLLGYSPVCKIYNFKTGYRLLKLYNKFAVTLSSRVINYS
jgi:hypothetical protein